MPNFRLTSPTAQVFINGEFVDTATDLTVDSYNPTTESKIGTCACCTSLTRPRS